MRTMGDILGQLETSKDLIRLYQSYWPNLIDESFLPEVSSSLFTAWNNCDELDIVLQETMEEGYGFTQPDDREELLVRISVEVGIRMGLEWAAGKTDSVERPTGHPSGRRLSAEGEEPKTSAE